MISLYTTAFNAEIGGFDLDSAYNNFSLIADEIVVATLKNKDSTIDVLNSLKEKYPIKVIETEHNVTTFAVDGILKNEALQNCSGDICIQMDADERAGNLDAWNDFLSNEKSILESMGDAKAIMLPVINLFGSVNQYKDIGRKWYVHRRGLKRGVVNFAKLPNGKFDKTKSDGCELLDLDGNLVPSVSFPVLETVEEYDDRRIPYIVHFGHADFIRRIRLNRNFWKKTWESYDGKPADVPLELSEVKPCPNIKMTGLDFSRLV